MNTTHQVAVLLATYNSERYIKTQLDSLINQSFQDFNVYIHDDGSTDGTLKIIGDYIKKYPNISILEDNIKGRQAAASFMWLLEKVDADYYMFCDHDDVWLPDKIALSVIKIGQMESAYGSNMPCIVHSDLIVVDDRLICTADSFWRESKIKPTILENFNYIGVCNCVTGCTMIFNEAAKKISLPYFKGAPMHDWWVAANVARDGRIQHLSQATILYRQHGDNVVGARTVDGSYFIRRLISLRNTLREHKELQPFLRKVRYGGFIKYYFFKLLYLIRRLY